jgi:hypothetical protein
MTHRFGRSTVSTCEGVAQEEPKAVGVLTGTATTSLRSPVPDNFLPPPKIDGPSRYRLRRACVRLEEQGPENSASRCFARLANDRLLCNLCE